MGSRVVCVTGASGFIASWLVKLLLERGYTVRASVRDPENLEKTGHLRMLQGANERLELFKADLLTNGSFDAAIDGCDGVFHTASPLSFIYKNPQEDLIDPAVKGTLNVLSACAKANSVKRVVLTSSTAAVVYNPSRMPEDVVDESFWSDPEYLKQLNNWYHVSKVLSEEAAWQFSKEKGLDMVTINPAMVIGCLLQPTVNATCEIILKFLTGATSTFPNVAVGWVDVKDVAEAHILAYELPTASGRYLCAERVVHYAELAEILHNLFPGYSIPAKCADEKSPRAIAFKMSTEKLQNLGIKYTPLEKSIKECVDSLREWNLLKLDS